MYKINILFFIYYCYYNISNIRTIILAYYFKNHRNGKKIKIKKKILNNSKKQQNNKIHTLLKNITIFYDKTNYLSIKFIC